MKPAPFGCTRHVTTPLHCWADTYGVLCTFACTEPGTFTRTPTSRKVRSRTWRNWFSIFQWLRIHAANALPVAAPGGRPMTGGPQDALEAPVPVRGHHPWGGCPPGRQRSREAGQNPCCCFTVRCGRAPPSCGQELARPPRLAGQGARHQRRRVPGRPVRLMPARHAPLPVRCCGVTPLSKMLVDIPSHQRVAESIVQVSDGSEGGVRGIVRVVPAQAATVVPRGRPSWR